MAIHSHQIPPPIARGDLPQLNRLPGLKFQALCRDIFDGEPGIQQCEEFGINGQSQKGIDLLAHNSNGTLEVGQCKGERDFPPAKIRKASKEFFDEWNYWRDRQVSRFVLFVACEMNQTQRREEIENQRSLFSQMGIQYELWPVSKIVNKLRPHRGIVSTHLGEAWIDYVCGTAREGLNTQLAGLLALNERITIGLSNLTDERVLRAKHLWQAGQRREARDVLAEIKNDQPIWISLAPHAKASALRLEAAIIVDSGGDLDTAIKLLTEAKAWHHHSDEIRIAAAIAWRQGKPAEAIRQLEDSDDPAANVQRALFLAMLGRSPEADSILGSVSDQPADRPRVEALVHLSARRLPEARAAILKAIEKTPDDLSSQFAGAVIGYCSGIPPLILNQSVPSWPEPVDWRFILRDDEAQKRRKEAGQVFRRFLDASDFTEEERRTVGTWYFACLATDPERQELAETELRTLLMGDLLNHRLLVWATARYPQMEFPTAVTALRAEVIDGRANTEQVLALVHYYISKRKLPKARKLLDRTRDAFVESGHLNVWIGWSCQLSTLTEGRDAGLAALRNSSVPEDEARLLTAKVLRLAGDTEQLPRHLSESYDLTGDAHFLLDLMELQAKNGQWQAASERCEQLAKHFRTAEILWFTVMIAQRANRPDICLRLLNDGEELFPSSKLPSELRQLRIHSQHLLGLLPSALDEAERLAAEEPTVDNLMALIELSFSIGDHRRVCSIAERVLQLEKEGSSRWFLRLACQCQWEDTTLARKLWLKACSLGFEDASVVPAFTLASTIGGLDDHLNDVSRRMAELATRGEGGVQIATLDTLKRMEEAFAEGAQRSIALYEQGRSPVHVVAQSLNLTIAQIYHQNPQEAAAAVFGWTTPCVLARHGRKPLPSLTQAPQTTKITNLKADVTALLFAYHFAFLERVEDAFRPISITSRTIPSLMAMQESLTAAQASRVSDYQEILRMMAEDKIAKNSDPETKARTDVPPDLPPDWASRCEQAKARGGFLVAFVPLVTASRSIPLSDLPEDLRSAVVGQKAVLRSLLEFGPLTQAEYDSYLDRLAIKSQPVDEIPNQGCALYFYGTAVEPLAHVGLLPVLCERFNVFIENDEARRIGADIASHQRKTDVALWVKSLQTHLSDGLKSGTYVLLPHKPADSENEGSATNGDLLALGALIESSNSPDEQFWADDRWLNGHEQIGTAKMVDSIGLLQALVAHERLSEAEYFGLIGRMRAEGVCFIPLSAEEIWHCLRQARVQDGRLIETTQAKNLRRGAAVSFLRSAILQRSVITPDAIQPDLGELPFLLQSFRACETVLSELWMIYGDRDAELQALVSWVVESLYVPHHGLHSAPGRPSFGPDASSTSAFSVAALMAKAIPLLATEEGRRAMKRYLTWVFQRFVQHPMHLSPQYLVRVAAAFRNLLSDLVPKELTDMASQASAIVLRRFFQDLPQPLQDEIWRDRDLAAGLGLRHITVVEFAGLRFDRLIFLQGAKEAINGGPATVELLDQAGQVEFYPLASIGTSVSFKHPTTGETGTIGDPSLQLLADSVEQRQLAAERLLPELDLPLQERASEVADLISIEDLATRLDRVEVLQQRSLICFLNNIKVRIAERSGIREHDLVPPKPEALYRFLRIEPTLALNRVGLLVSYTQLRKEGPIEGALDRASRVPTELPDLVESDVQSVSPERRRDLIRSLLRANTTPIFRIQLARLLIGCFGDEPLYKWLGNRIMRGLIETMNFELPAYLTLVRWAARDIRRWQEAQGWSAGFRLTAAWILGDRLFECFRGSGVDPDWIVQSFTVTSGRADSIFEDRPDWHGDVGHPANVTPEALVICALSYVFTGHLDKVELRLRRQIADVLLIASEDYRFPVLPLLANPATAPNALDSFLRRDRIEALCEFLEPEKEALVRSAFKLDAGAQASSALDSPGSEGWLVLSMVTGGFPPKADLISFVEQAMKRMDLERGELADAQTEALVLSIATSLLPFVTDTDLTEHLKKQLMAFVRRLRNSTATKSIVAIILESALNISRQKASVSERVAEFSELAVQLVMEWPKLGELARPIIQWICEELSAEQTGDLWRLNLRLRTHSTP